MSTKKKYTYDPDLIILKSVENPDLTDPRLTITVKINLKDSTMHQNH